MEGFFTLLILLCVICVLSGPVALIVGLVALSRIKRLQSRRPLSASEVPIHRPIPTAPTPVSTPPAAEEPKTADTTATQPPARANSQRILQSIHAEGEAAPSPEELSFEQRIGTRWVLVAGLVTVIFAVGFFLKYAYDNNWIRPQTRVVIATIAGLLALGLGEVTRRRGYGIVSKGVTALGFAILYATVFAAHRWYALIGSVPAFALATCITAAAMLYAIALDEVIAALLALIGGYVTPVVVSTGQNLPNPLFSYVLILSAGAMLCAFWRRWHAVNILAFVGTFVLYTGWFEKFYRPAIRAADLPDQLGVALFWVLAFFLVYLVLPILHGLVRRVRSQTTDVLSLLANAAVVFYYLWTLLAEEYRPWLALGSLSLGTVHLLLMGVVFVRCRSDVNLQQTLLAIGLFLMTVTVPLYLEMYAIAITWAIEAVVLTVIGLRYRNLLVQVAAILVLGLAVERLVQEWPMHSTSFRAILNPAFSTWLLVSAAILVCHVLYRLDQRVSHHWRSSIVEVLYTVGLLLLAAAISQEMWYHGELNLSERGDQLFFAKYIALVFPGLLLLLVARPVCPRGQLCSGLAMVVALMGSLCTVITFAHVHESEYAIFLNSSFIRAMVLVAALLAGAWFLRSTELKEPRGFVPPLALAMTALGLLWILLTQEIWYFWRCLDRYRTPMANWQFIAQMCISIVWAAYAIALMVVGFWKRVKLLRYVALAVFVLLLGKIFIIDTRNVSSLYRIAGFLVTGMALVSVSYLYQYLKKQGFFEAMLADGGKTSHRSGGS